MAFGFGVVFAFVLVSWAGEAEDPNLWLEEVTGERALQWVEERNAETVDELDGSAYTELKGRIQEILDSDERIPYVQKMGDHYYNFWQDADHVRGIWRRTTLDEYKKAEPAWELVLDLDQLNANSNESVPLTWGGASCLPPAYQRCMLALAPGGSDADLKREFDLTTKSWVDGGFTLPQAKSDVSWVDQDTLMVMTDLGEGTTTSSGYPRQVRLWKRGTPLAEAPVIFEGQGTDVSVWGYKDHAPGFEREIVGRSTSFFAREVYLRRPEGNVRIPVPEDANANPWREWLLIELRSDWEVGGKTWPAGSLLATKLEPFLAGEQTFEALFTPSPTRALASLSSTQGALVLDVLDQVRSRAQIARPGPNGWTIEDMPGLPELDVVSIWAVDADQSDDVWVSTTGFLTPSTLSLGSVAPGAPVHQTVKSLPAFFDATGLEVSQHFATSADGTKVPYFQVAKKGLKLNGKNPTLLYGYGGFEVSMRPSYSAATGVAWLERGGVYVLANIRGGGEFGPTWHESAMRENKPRSYEDFAAVAKDLIARKVTRPRQLGAMGGSNGGLLMGNMLVSYPQLFGAIVCQVPLLDMKRYSQLLAGASWIEEYGDPQDPKQWSYIQTFSPYQLLRSGEKYPDVLFITSTRDDRVHPGHARKMAAKMLGMGYDVMYWENTEGGHGAASTSEQRAKMWALSWSFLWDELG